MFRPWSRTRHVDKTGDELAVFLLGVGYLLHMGLLRLTVEAFL